MCLKIKSMLSLSILLKHKPDLKTAQPLPREEESICPSCLRRREERIEGQRRPQGRTCHGTRRKDPRVEPGNPCLAQAIRHVYYSLYNVFPTIFDRQ